jgi:protein ImuA
MRPGPTHLLRHPGLRPAAAAATPPPGVATGHASLDALLHWRGWPAAALTELLAEPGLGEFSLVIPALARLTAAGGLVFLIDPPHLPHAQALCQAGLPGQRLLVLRCPASRDRFWAAEQILRSGTCAALALWEGTEPWRHAQLLRLQSTARTTATPVFLYRRPQAIRAASPAPLRIGLQGSRNGIRLHIHKQPGPSGQTLALVPSTAAVIGPVRAGSPQLLDRQPPPQMANSPVGHGAPPPRPQVLS